MKKENINVRVEEITKIEFFDTCRYLGVRPSVVLRNFIQSINNLRLEEASQLVDTIYEVAKDSESRAFSISSKSK